MRVENLRLVSGVGDLPAPSPEIIELLDAWRAARADALVPLKRDFDPLMVPHLLPCLWMYRFDRESETFTCRLAGERINSAWGHGIAGRRSLEIFGPQDNDVIVSIWKTILSTPLIHYGKEEALAGNATYSAERLVLPLAEEGGSLDFILGLSLYAFGRSPTDPPTGIVENACHILCRDL